MLNQFILHIIVKFLSIEFWIMVLGGYILYVFMCFLAPLVNEHDEYPGTLGNWIYTKTIKKLKDKSKQKKKYAKK